MTGITATTDFPTTPGAFQPAISNPGGIIELDAFVLKLDSTGSSLLYSTYLGGSNQDFGADDIEIDLAGNAYVVGGTRSSNFPVTAGVVQPSFGGGDDGFVTKLNPTGTALVYSTYLGGGTNFGERVSHIALDSSGNAYLTGRTPATDFPTTGGAFQTTYGGGGFDAFVAKINSTATTLLFSTYLGGSGADDNGLGAAGIGVDASGNIIVAGATFSTDFPTTAGAAQPSLNGARDAFLTTLDPSGATLLDSTYLGGSGSEVGNLAVVDSIGNVYFTGSTDSTDFPVTAGAFDSTANGSGDAFVVKIAAPLTQILVNSNADPGDGVCDTSECTLREAIDASNSLAGRQTIAFNISGAGPHTIAPVSALPVITDPVIIDGYTEPGASANTLAVGSDAVLMIELDGTDAGTNGLTITAADSIVRGLVINRFSAHGISITGAAATGNVVEGNFIGTDVTGYTGGAGASLRSSFDAGLGFLVSIAFDPASGNVFLYPDFDPNIFEYTPAGSQVGTIPQPGASSDSIDLDFAPESLSIGGTVVAADTLLVANGSDSPEILYGVDTGSGAVLASQALTTVSTVGASYHADRNTLFSINWTSDTSQYRVGL